MIATETVCMYVCMDVCVYVGGGGGGGGAGAVICIFLPSIYLLPGAPSGQCCYGSYLSHKVKRGLSLSMTRVRRTRGTIQRPLLALNVHHRRRMLKFQVLQYRHYIPVPVDWTSGRTNTHGLHIKNISQEYQRTTLLANQSYVQFRGHSCIHVQETRWQSGVRSCIIIGLPAHLVKLLNIGTVEA